MLTRTSSSIALALAVGVGLAVACIGPSQVAGGACEEFGGVCVTTASLCGGELPYACSTGTCCNSQLPGAPDASPSFDSGALEDVRVTLLDTGVPFMSTGDATSPPTPEASTPDVTSRHDAPAAPEASTPDSGVDTGVDAQALDAKADTKTEDAHGEDAKGDSHVADAKHDSAPHDAGHDSAILCNHYASPTEPATMCNTAGKTCTLNTDCPSNDCHMGMCTALCPSDPNCQPNSCLNGDWCHLTTGNCVMPSAVQCDGGV